MPYKSVLVEMAEAGVDAALLTPVGVYGSDNTYELEASKRYPRKFQVVGWVDHTDPEVEDAVRADAEAGMRGVRLLGLRDAGTIESGSFDRVLQCCAELELAVAISLGRPLSTAVMQLFERFDTVRFVVDHLGLGVAPPLSIPPPYESAFEHIASVLDLSRYPNVWMKLTGAAALSDGPFPFTDIWPYLYRYAEAFGPERLMWGSDFTRTSGLVSYWDGVHYLAHMDQFTSADLDAIYGQTLRDCFRWQDRPHEMPQVLPAWRSKVRTDRCADRQSQLSEPG
jgi:L-fuconolactonase